MTPGYQIAQVAHAVADFALHRPEQFTRWHSESQHIVALQASSATALETLHREAFGPLDVVAFHEPDLGNALTSLAFVPHAHNRRFLARLPLAGGRAGTVDKHHLAHHTGTTDRRGV